MVEVEALAIECGLLLAREQKLPQIIVESGALIAVQSITATEKKWQSWSCVSGNSQFALFF